MREDMSEDMSEQADVARVAALRDAPLREAVSMAETALRSLREECAQLRADNAALRAALHDVIARADMSCEISRSQIERARAALGDEPAWAIVVA